MDFKDGIEVGEELIARVYDRGRKMFSLTPCGYACVCAQEWVWPIGSTSGIGLGCVTCKVRWESGGINDFDDGLYNIPVEHLVFASDWVISDPGTASHSVRGCPVGEKHGSPLGVALRIGSRLLVAGNCLELALVNPEKYKRGKTKISLLVIGFYCCKKAFAKEGAIYHVRTLKILAHFTHFYLGTAVGVLAKRCSSCW